VGIMEWNIPAYKKPREKVGNWTLDKYAWDTGHNVQYNHNIIKGLQLHVSKIYSSNGDYYEVHLYRYRVYYKNKFIKKYSSLLTAYAYAQAFMEEVSDDELKTGDY